MRTIKVLTLHEGGHVLKLGNAVGPEDTILLEHLEHFAVFHASVLGHQVQNHVEHGGPCGSFISSVFDAWDGVTAVKQIKNL